ncbi:hypothetical protein B0T12DRAFT_404475 [Alternaria alternata]|nr:hypothetical protein B0T12DRAFT_404475 [Alternaria alternata]
MVSRTAKTDILHDPGLVPRPVHVRSLRCLAPTPSDKPPASAPMTNWSTHAEWRRYTTRHV